MHYKTPNYQSNHSTKQETNQHAFYDNEGSHDLNTACFYCYSKPEIQSVAALSTGLMPICHPNDSTECNHNADNVKQALKI